MCNKPVSQLMASESAAVRVRVGAFELRGVHGVDNGLPAAHMAPREIGIVRERCPRPPVLVSTAPPAHRCRVLYVAHSVSHTIPSQVKGRLVPYASQLRTDDSAEVHSFYTVAATSSKCTVVLHVIARSAVRARRLPWGSDSVTAHNPQRRLQRLPFG